MTSEPEFPPQRLDDVATAIHGLVQGELLHLPSLPLLASTDNSVTLAGHHAATRIKAHAGVALLAPVKVDSSIVMVVTQTCDLQERATLKDRRTIHVAPVIFAAQDGDVARAAQGGRTPRYVPVPWCRTPAGAVAVADLDYISLLDRGVVRATSLGRPPEANRRRLAHDLGRPWSRPALPDDVDRVVSPIRDRVLEARHANLRRIFDEGLYQVRVQWTGTSPNMAVVVHLIPYPDWYPDIEPREHPPQIKQNTVTVADVISRLRDRPDDPDYDTLPTRWHQLAALLTTACTSSLTRLSKQRQEQGRTVTIASVVVTVSILDHEILEDTDLLDLAHLSFLED